MCPQSDNSAPHSDNNAPSLSLFVVALIMKSRKTVFKLDIGRAEPFMSSCHRTTGHWRFRFPRSPVHGVGVCLRHLSVFCVCLSVFCVCLSVFCVCLSVFCVCLSVFCVCLSVFYPFHPCFKCLISVFYEFIIRVLSTILFKVFRMIRFCQPRLCVMKSGDVRSLCRAS